MAYVNGTTHYNLPQTVGTDKRDWADTNQAFADIDAALYGAVDDVAQAQTEIDALTGRMNTAEQNIATNTGDIAGLDTRLTTAEGAITSQAGQITDVRADVEDMICAYNEATATSTHAYAIGDYFIYNDVLYRAIQAIAIGDTIVPDTNCTTTNVTTEILAIEDLSGDVSQLQTDVSQLQTDVAAKGGYKVVKTLTANNDGYVTILQSLFSDLTGFDHTKDHIMLMVSSTNNVYTYRQSVSSASTYIFTRVQETYIDPTVNTIIESAEYTPSVKSWIQTTISGTIGGAGSISISSRYNDNFTGTITILESLQ